MLLDFVQISSLQISNYVKLHFSDTKSQLKVLKLSFNPSLIKSLVKCKQCVQKWRFRAKVALFDLCWRVDFLIWRKAPSGAFGISEVFM